METQSRFARTIVTPAFAAAAIYAFAANGVLRYAPPGDVFVAGSVLAGGVMVILGEDREDGSWKQLAFGGAIAALGALMLSSLGDRASKIAFVNDARCLAIQQDMLSAHPRMTNPADAFQGLGCRPQGEDGRIFVPATDRERAAGKPLRWGGYPPPQ